MMASDDTIKSHVYNLSYKNNFPASLLSGKDEKVNKVQNSPTLKFILLIQMYYIILINSVTNLEVI